VRLLFHARDVPESMKKAVASDRTPKGCGVFLRQFSDGRVVATLSMASNLTVSCP